MDQHLFDTIETGLGETSKSTAIVSFGTFGYSFLYPKIVGAQTNRQLGVESEPEPPSLVPNALLELMHCFADEIMVQKSSEIKHYFSEVF